MKESFKQPDSRTLDVKTPPIKPGEVFEPRKSLHELKDAQTRAKQMLEERVTARRELREKLNYQKEGRVLMQEKLIEEIRKNPDIGLDRLEAIAGEYFDKYGFGHEAQIMTKHILEDYVHNHDKIIHYREKYPDNKDLYTALFGVAPRGDISDYDYAWVYNGKFLEILDTREGQMIPILNKSEIEEADWSDGASLRQCAAPGLEGIVNIENISQVLKKYNISSGDQNEISKYEEYSKRIRTHEEQHSLIRIFKSHKIEKGGGLGSVLTAITRAQTKDEKEIAVRNYFVLTRELGEHRYRDELLAFLKESADPNIAHTEELLDLLSQAKERGGLYDFWNSQSPLFHESEYLEPLGLNPSEYASLWDQVFVKEYEDILKNGIKAFVALRGYGYSPEATVAHLITEPVVRWPQVARRAIKHKMEMAE